MVSTDDVERAALALGAQRGSPLRLDEFAELRAHRVARFSVSGAGPGDDSVIVKVADRSTGSERGLAAIRTEHAALEFLREIGSSSAARLLAADPDHGVLVLEDLGDGPSLADVLLHGDRTSAQQACIATAAWLGRLHAETVGGSGRYDDIGDRLGTPRDGADRFMLRGRDLRDCLDGLDALLASRDLPHVGASRDLQTVVAELAAPGDLLAMSTGDPCPDNGALLVGGVRCFDLEAAAFRHALVDVAHYTIPFPNCWCWRRLPVDVSESMLREHRSLLAATSSQAADPDRYLEALTRAMGAWVVWTLDRRLPHVDDDAKAAPRIVEAIDNFVRHARRHRDLVALTDEVEAVAEVLRARRSIPEAPTYPAFGGPAWTGP